MKLTMALNTTEELPPPKSVHLDLKICMLKTLEGWYEKFGPHYKKLEISYHFIKNNKEVSNMIKQSEVQAKAREQQAERDQMKKMVMCNKVCMEFEEKKDQIEGNVLEIELCFDLLIPTLDTINSDSEVEGNETKKPVWKPDSSSSNIIIKFDDRLTINETKDNTDLVQSLHDRINQLEKFQKPHLNKWMSTLVDKGAEQSTILPILTVKEDVDRSLRKFNDLNIVRSNKRRRIVQKEEDDCSEDEFEEVESGAPMFGEFYEEFKCSAEECEAPKEFKEIVVAIETIVAEEQVPSTKVTHAGIENPNISVVVETQEEKQRRIDTEQFSDVVLGKAEEAADDCLQQNMIKFDSLHRFWSPKDVDTELSIDSVRALNPKYQNLPGKFEPVKWECRAPLSTGKLCPRKDRFKCPLHGKIVARDEGGKVKIKNPSNELFEELANSSGVIVHGKGKKRQSFADVKRKREDKDKASNLIKVKPLDTARTRIEKKIFNKAAIKRVNRAADDSDTKRNNERFSQQFNYSNGQPSRNG